MAYLWQRSHASYGIYTVGPGRHHCDSEGGDVPCGIGNCGEWSYDEGLVFV